jgi:Methyltransferase domain
MGSRYTGIDFSQEMVTAAKRNIRGLIGSGNADVCVGDVTNLSSPDMSFDVVTAMGVIELSQPRRSGPMSRRNQAGSAAWGRGRVNDTQALGLGQRRFVAVLRYPLRKLIRKRPLSRRRRKNFSAYIPNSSRVGQSLRTSGSSEN